MPPLAHMRQGRACRILGAVLGLLLVTTAACGPGESARPGESTPAPHVQRAPNEPAVLLAPTPTPDIQRTSNPTWHVPPSIEEQIFFADVIVRATLQSATAAVETLPSGPGVAPTHQAVQELRFTVHEYLKGSGPTELLVVVRGGHGNPTEAAVRDFADWIVHMRVTTWDARQAVLFLEAPARPYTPAASGEAAGSSERSTPSVWQFVLSNYDQPPWAYSVDTLSRAWLPAENPPAEGEAPTAFITDGVQSPPPTITLADLRARIAALAAELQAGDGIDGYDYCIYGRIIRERYRRAHPRTLPLMEAALGSGSLAGSEVFEARNDHRQPQYHRYWLSGPDAVLFQPVIVDDDGEASTGYTRRLTAARPLPAGEYDVLYNSQHYARFPCNFVPDDAYLAFTVTVTAPAGTVHEAFFDPAALGRGVVGRDAAQAGCWRRQCDGRGRRAPRPLRPAEGPAGLARPPRPCGG